MTTKTYKTHVPKGKPDAKFKPVNGNLICEYCDQRIMDHRVIYGKGQWKGWRRYRCLAPQVFV